MKIKNNNKKYKKKIQWLKDSNPHRKCKPSVIGMQENFARFVRASLS